MIETLNSIWNSEKTPTVSRISWEQADDGADTELPFEAEPHIDEHQGDAEQNGHHAFLHQLLADCGPTTSTPATVNFWPSCW